jgi:2-polyprenyl-3-methyl-5-hydroxy-6-metoxy-1,4-benzoquinol methylase
MTQELRDLGYVLDQDSKVWSCPGYASIKYNDGDEVETRLQTVIASVGDVSTLSSQLKTHCVDWPSTYHLSSARANILRPFGSELAGKKVLEIGAGCGAITRYLGEMGARVLALEGSLRRAAIARDRTRDLKNVEVLSENFDNLNLSGVFDVVTLIGVLEYAPMFIRGENPALEMLRRARRMLANGGRLIIAIENKLGLKYFAGAREDHTGVAMYGLESRYEKGQAKTFGKRELEELLREAGFLGVETLAPFPDYKFPVSIVTPQGFSTPEFDVAALIQHSVDADPQLPSAPGFSMRRVWPAIVQNNLAADLSNSFLVVAYDDGRLEKNQDILAYHFNTNREASFCKQSEFYFQSGKLYLRYKRLCPQDDTDEHSSLMSMLLPEQVPYCTGTLLAERFYSLLAKQGWRIDDFGALLKEYADWILSLEGAVVSKVKDNYDDCIVSGKFFDAIPANIVIRGQGSWELIDTEWVYKGEFTFHWLIFRTLLSLLRGAPDIQESSPELEPTQGAFMIAAFGTLGISLSSLELETFCQREAFAQAAVLGKHFSESFWSPGHPLVRSVNAFEQLERLEQALAFSGAVAEASVSHHHRDELHERLLADRQVSQRFDVIKRERQLLEDRIKSLQNEVQATHHAWALRGEHIERQGQIELALRGEVEQLKQQLQEGRVDLVGRGRSLKGTARSGLLKVLRTRSVKECGRGVISLLRSARRAYSAARVSYWVQTNRRLVAQTGLFDAEYYRKENRDKVPPEADPLEHFLLHGGYAGLKCSPLFDAGFYLERYPEVRAQGLHPLVHYITDGRKEGRQTTQHLSPDFYLGQQSKAVVEVPRKDEPRAPVARATLCIVYGAGHLGFLKNVLFPSLKAHPGKRPVELHLVNYAENIALFDSGPLSESVSIRDWSAEREPGHIGFGEGHNFLFRKANPRDAFVIVNPDSCPMPGCLDALFDRYEKSSAGIVEARQWPRPHPKEYDPETGNTPWASGAFSLIDAEVFRAIEGFDPLFFLYGEDVDLSWRVWRAGKRVVYAPEAICSHFTGMYSYRNDRMYHEHFYSPRNFIVLARKFFGEPGEAYAIREVRQCGYPEDFKASILASYQEIKGLITELSFIPHPMIKILAMNVFHLSQPSSHLPPEHLSEEITPQEAIAHAG